MYTMFACGEQMALDLLLLPGLISAAPDLSQAVPVDLRGSRSLHSQVCRLCRFCATSDFFFLFLFSSALGATREKRRGGGSHAAGWQIGLTPIWQSDLFNIYNPRKFVAACRPADYLFLLDQADTLGFSARLAYASASLIKNIKLKKHRSPVTLKAASNAASVCEALTDRRSYFETQTVHRWLSEAVVHPLLLFLHTGVNIHVEYFWFCWWSLKLPSMKSFSKMPK